MIKTAKQIKEILQDVEDDVLYEFTKKQSKGIRSIAQNKYYHGTIIPIIADYMGEGHITAHFYIKELFGIETTTNLDPGEFKWMCEKIIEFFKRYGVRIPLPNEDKELENLDKYLF